MKTKHNKKRNTAFIFEVLIRELSKAVVRQEPSMQDKVVKIIHEHFKRGSVLKEELHCYQALSEKIGVDNYTAEKLIHRSKKLHESFNKTEIFQEQSAVIKKINTTLGPSVFSNFVPNYKTFATIAQIFSDKTPVKQKVLMEKHILEVISTSESPSEEKEPLDTLVVKSFSERYNKQYESLLPEQKNLLNKYMLSFGENAIDYRLALGKELGRIESAIQESLTLPEVASDSIMLENSRKVLSDIKLFNVSKVDEKGLRKILKLQSLVREYTDDASQD